MCWTNIFSKVQTRQKSVFRHVQFSQTSLPYYHLPPTYKKLHDFLINPSCVSSYKGRQIFIYLLISLLTQTSILLMLFCTLLSLGKIPTSELLGKGNSTVLLDIVKFLSLGVVSSCTPTFNAWKCFIPHSFAPKIQCYGFEFLLISWMKNGVSV